ncbi:MAG: DUF427 domain-containing protein [Oscillochloris sp.]|nr:DUF427 domain-containing protein [Oscillochloris sp.]
MINRIEPGPGQESVWDYPRPPRLEPIPRQIRIIFNGVEIASTRRAYRVLETSHPPVYYLPPEDIQMQHLRRTARGSVCEWKGRAAYYTLTLGGRTVEDVAWCYPSPTPEFAPISGYLAFYAGPMDACYVGDERVTPQPGEFYGGWITSEIVGPFKGGPGSWGW